LSELGIGIVGAGWMGHAHAAGYRRLSELWPESDADVELVVIADADIATAATAAQRFGFLRSTDDWHEVVESDDVHIVDVTAPNHIHAEVVAAAARAGKAIACEKPLARDLTETAAVVRVVEQAGVVSQVGFSYRLVPGVQYARGLAAAGELGDLLHLRAWFLTDYGSDPAAPFSWRYDHELAGAGAIGDLGAHLVEMAEGLAGPITSIAAAHARFIGSRPDPGFTASHFATPAGDTSALRAVTNDDAFVASARFACGALGVLEANRVVGGPRASFGFELYGTRGSVRWDLERMNEIELFEAGASPARSGFRRVVSGPSHPDFSPLSPGPGVGLGWQDLKTIEAHRLVSAIRTGAPSGAAVDVALRVAILLDAIERSSASGRWEVVDEARAG
jgi:predicted dehydrogenase